MLGSDWGRSWKQVCSRTPPRRHHLPRNVDILAPLGGFGAPLGAKLAPNGGPRVSKWRTKSIKIDAKIDAKNDAEKDEKNLEN